MFLPVLSSSLSISLYCLLACYFLSLVTLSPKQVRKAFHIQALHRLADEKRSAFSAPLLLNDRYQLMGLLGKGGFSEVHKASDWC